MIIIQQVLISEDVIAQQFMCNLNACKGACCWEGDYGAPLEEDEIAVLEAEYAAIEPFLSESGKKTLEREGLYTFFKEAQDLGAPVQENGACAYLTYDEQGIAKCGIERAHAAGATTFKKPVSCHLYPIRIERNKVSGYDMMNYDRWDICSAACTLGRQQQMPVYQFAREALIRKYGAAFFEELEAAALELGG